MLICVEEGSNFHLHSIQLLASIVDPNHKFIFIEQKSGDAPAELVCSSPSAVLSDEGDNIFVVSGLCQVSRQVIKYVAACSDSDAKQILSLLGHKQSCVKACSQVSCWTRFCEVEFPRTVQDFIQQLNSQCFTIPVKLISLEKEFSVPQKTPNGHKYSKSHARDKLALRDCVDLNDLDDLKNKNDKLKSLYYCIHNILCNCTTTNEDTKLLYCEKVASSCPSNLSITISHSKDVPKETPSVNPSFCTDNLNIHHWPYLTGFKLTLADILVISSLCELLFPMVHWPQFINEFEQNLPNISCWLVRCLSKDTMLKAVRNVWLHNNTSLVHNPFDEQTDKYFHDLQLLYPDNFYAINHVSYSAKPQNAKQMHTSTIRQLPIILQKCEEAQLETAFSKWNVPLKSCDWSDLPEGVDPTTGELNAARAERKRQQIDNILARTLELSYSGATIVDFCAGGGHVGIVIAALRPDCQVILIENKEESLDRARARVRRLGLGNVRFLLANLDYFRGSFDVGVSLHACGTATDLVMEMCASKRASFVICPCCYGSIKPTSTISFPRSVNFADILTSEEYSVLARAADLNCSNGVDEYNKWGKHCMGLVDEDRLSGVRATGYRCDLRTCQPPTCSPKNNLLTGVHVGSS